jgi:hypothetical protein
MAQASLRLRANVPPRIIDMPNSLGEYSPIAFVAP